ncbi:MAG: hypothetical protein Q8L86_05900 [Vicinamibacterales bacterium]|nr:hypothetical protein [Vicinamibacterales bacterium]
MRDLQMYLLIWDLLIWDLLIWDLLTWDLLMWGSRDLSSHQHRITEPVAES